MDRQNPSRGRISVNEQNCCGCMQCMMVCALTWGTEGKLDTAAVKVSRDREDPYQFTISFEAYCRPGCRLCADWCAYGTLQLEEGSK